jgi:hypothetical protein
MIVCVSGLKATNLALKFVLELAALAAFAYWGATIAGGFWAVLLAVAVPATAAFVWGLFAAPRASRRLDLAARAPFELGVFGLAVLALFIAGETIAAIVLGALVIFNAVLLTVFAQWLG